MLILLPFHNEDAQRAVKTLETSAKLGFVTNHQLILLTPHYTRTELVREVDAAARKGFEVVHIHKIPSDVPSGWPAGPNHMFAEGASLVARHLPFEPKGAYTGNWRDNNGHFLWMEPDMVPLTVGYLDRLQGDYQISGKVCMGVITPTVQQEVLSRDEEGKPTSLGAIYYEGEHMVGAGIYARSISTNIEWIKYIPTRPEPFDIELQGEICQKQGSDYIRVSSTELIAHSWNSSNYRIVRNGDTVQVECDPHQFYPDKTGFLFNRFGRGPVVAHGCKDDSIYSVVAQINGWVQAEVTKVTNSTGAEVEFSQSPAPMGLVGKLSETPVGAALAKAVGALPSNTTYSEPEEQMGSGGVSAGTDPRDQELAELRAKVDALLNAQKQPQKARKVKSKAKAAKEPRPEIDEKGVYDYYTKAMVDDEATAYRLTLKTCRVSPVQLKRIRDKFDDLVR